MARASIARAVIVIGGLAAAILVLGIVLVLLYRLVNRDGQRCLVPVGAFEASAGHVEALVPPAENIHSAAAVGEKKTISIHVYGADIQRLGSSILRRFDNLRQLPAAA